MYNPAVYFVMIGRERTPKVRAAAQHGRIEGAACAIDMLQQTVWGPSAGKTLAGHDATCLFPRPSHRPHVLNILTKQAGYAPVTIAACVVR